MTVKAVMMGCDDKGMYKVNVKDTNAAGKIGGGGMIRVFETKEAAKDYVNAVNKTGVDVFEKKVDKPQEENVIHQGDVFVKGN